MKSTSHGDNRYKSSQVHELRTIDLSIRDQCLAKPLYSLTKKAQVLVLDRIKLTQSATVMVLNRSRAVVQNFLNGHIGYKTEERSGVPSKLSATAKKKLVRQAGEGNISAYRLRTSLNIEFSLRRDQKVLRRTPYFVCVLGGGRGHSSKHIQSNVSLN